MTERATLAVYFDDPNQFGYPLDNPRYVASYADFTRFCKQQNVRLYIVRGNSYQGNMTFSSGWEFQDDELKEVAGPLKVDAALIKGHNYVLKPKGGEKFLNNIAFDELAGNKWATYQEIGEYMSKTVRIDSENWQEAIASLPGEKVVLKPEAGLGGEGLYIFDKESVELPKEATTVPYLAQSFVDSSQGVPGLKQGVHDLRVICFDGEFKLATIRTPREGTLIANLAQGGTVTIIPIEQVPTEILKIAEAVDGHFQQYSPRCYTIDFLYGEDKPYVVELNPRPGFPSREVHGEAYVKQFFTYLLETFLKTAGKA